MIAEAEKNARERGVDNVAFAHMVPRQDPHALADALRLILQNPEMATTLGQAGRRKVVENYDWKHQITAMNQILSAACGVPSAGDTVGKL
jgi:D-inositol-3-phosphate glycosyltransferase